MRALMLAALLLAACGPKQTIDSPKASPLPTSSAEDSASRTSCARSVLTSFIDAFNSGDAAELATFFTPGAEPRAFQWFYVGGLTPAYGPPLRDLPRYFAEWHAAGERWLLVSVDAGAGPSWHGGIDFGMRVERTHGEASGVFQGKGALECAARRIFVFGLGSG
jgi:hypothetical protein